LFILERIFLKKPRAHLSPWAAVKTIIDLLNTGHEKTTSKQKGMVFQKKGRLVGSSWLAFARQEATQTQILVRVLS